MSGVCRAPLGFDDLMKGLTGFRKAAVLTIMADSRKKKKIQIKISKGKGAAGGVQGETRRSPAVLSPWSPVNDVCFLGDNAPGPRAWASRAVPGVRLEGLGRSHD